MTDDEPPPRRSARLEVLEPEEGESRGDRRLIVRDDDTRPGLELRGDAPAAVEAARPASAFESKLPFFGYEEADAVNRGKLSTWQVLAVRDTALILATGHAVVRAQIAAFLDDLRAQVQKDNRFKTAAQKLPAYEAWRKRMVALADAESGAERALDEMVRAEHREAERRDLFELITQVVRDLELSHDEHVLVRRRAVEYGYDDAALDAVYAEYRRTIHDFTGPLPPERGEAQRHLSWGKARDWRFEDLRNALIDDFTLGVRITNESPDHKESLIAYLEREFEDRMVSGEQARNAAIACECRALAVWHFLWANGHRELPLIPGHHPSADRSVASPDDLIERAGREYVLDDLANALADGLLEHWLRFSGVDAAIVRRVGELRNQAHGRTDRQRPSFLRKAAIQVLWSLGFRGLPLWTGARVVVVTSVTELVTHAEAYWDAVAWCLEHDVLGDWLETVSRADAVRARAATRSAAGNQALDLATWSFLWSSGSPRLLFSASRPVTPGSRRGVATSLDELRPIVDGGTQAAAIENLLLGGFLEAWLREAQRDERLAAATAQIVTDDRKLKVERFAQLIGCTRYQVAGLVVASVEDFAQLPLKVADPVAIWHHIREGVPQERFRNSPDAVRVLEEIRGDRTLSDAAKAMVACIRLGLRVLPHSTGRLRSASDVTDLLDAPGGRELLHGLLTSGVLEVWAEAIHPGAGALVANERGAPAHLAADRVSRLLGARSIHPVPGRRALALSSITFDDLVDPLARARVRDALYGPLAIPGLPDDLARCSEQELDAWPASERAHVFGWQVLRLATLEVQGRPIASIDQLVAAIAEPAVRAEVQRLAQSGVLGVWIEGSQRHALSPGLQGQVHPGRFPALCLELGEPPPTLEFHWSRRTATVGDGQTADFELVVVNRDPVRVAHLEFDHRRPLGLTVAYVPLMIVEPGEPARAKVTLCPAKGKAGEIRGEVEIRHAHPDRRQPPCETARLGLSVGFPWPPLVFASVAWMLCGALLMLIMRATLQASVGEPGGLGLATAAVLVAIERFAVWRIAGRFWLHPPDESLVDMIKVGAIIIFLILGIKECHQAASGDGARALAATAMVTTGLYFLVQRDVLAATILAIAVLARRSVGVFVLEAAGGMDRVCGRLIGVFDTSGSTTAMLIGWTIAGGVLGLATGLAIGFRAINRPHTGELVRLGVLLVALLLCLGGAR